MRVTMKDCERQTFRGSGPGGQHRNKTDSGVRIIHRASGARGESCDTRSQHENEKIAFRRMAESPVFRNWVAQQMGSSDLPESSSDERIRTYNLVDNRVTDHRTGHKSSAVSAILDGDIDKLYE